MGRTDWKEKVTLDGIPYYHNPSTHEITWDKPDELLSRDEVEANKGDWHWVPHPTELWQPARKVGEDSDGASQMVTEAGKKLTIPADGVVEGPASAGRRQEVPLWSLTKSSLMRLEDDLVMSDGINEGTVSHTIREHYKDNGLYTWVGAAHTVLVSVNPYKRLPLYGPDAIDLHFRKPPSMKLPPHPFAIAADAFQSLLVNATNQSILISGESGAGKTEATKQCLKFLAQVAGSENNVEDKIIMANPLLEAFGNAKTIRNNNSSRFGKWIEVYFDAATSSICGANIQNYLLERSRVVFQAKNERNFHVFYQMCQDRQLTQALELEDPKDFRYMNQSGLVRASDVDDASDLAEVQAAMDALGWEGAERDWVFRMAAAVLHLGNVEFSAKKEKGNVSGSQVKSQKPLGLAAEYLGVEAAALEKVLCYRSISVRRETNVIPLNPSDARDSCDSLAKGLYGRLFDHLVRRVNESLKGREGRFIGVLDIFGFEVFDNNSFEQLCINYCNEKLQQHFNRTTFKEEEALYLKEGIDFQHVDFIDNQEVLDLIEKKPVGILLMLDEEALVPEGNNTKLMNKIEQHHKRNKKFQTDKHRRLDNSLAFELVHYAGVVKYDSSKFLEKNKDTLFQDAYDVCAASSDDFTASLFPDVGRRQLKSLSYQFRVQLSDLMDVLYETESRYIRCVKPNGKQRPDDFDTPLVVEQLRYSGVFEAIAIRKQGYPFRLSFRQFRCRYSCINIGHRYKARGSDDQAACKEIMATARQDFSDAQFGKTLVLYRAHEHKLLMLLRNLALEGIVPTAQKVLRGGIAREFTRRLARATAGLQEALDVANDIDMMDAAIAAVDDIIGPTAKVFRSKPVNLPAAKAARADLKKWVDLEKQFARLTRVEEPSQGDFKELSAAVEKASALLHIPRTDSQVELYDLARAQTIYMSIKLQEAFLDKDGHKYDRLGALPALRDPKDYSKKKLMGKRKAEELMLVAQKSKIPAGLTALDDKALDKAAVAVHAGILAFTGLKKHKDPDAMGAFVVQEGIDNAALRDEIFAQLLKQTTDADMVTGPNGAEAGQKAWDLLAVCVACFSPSEEMEPFLLMHFRKSEDNQRLVSAFHQTKYGKKPTSAPRAISSAVNAFKSNADRSRFSVMPQSA